MDEYIGVIKYFTTTYVPSGFLQCNGAILQTSEYTALFGLLGNRFGGNNPTTFGLPNITTKLTGSSQDVGWCICYSGTFPVRS